jgi:hypothetical protein
VPGALPDERQIQTLRQWICDKLELDEEEKVDVAWWIASLLHDHAYPLAHMLRITPSVARENRQNVIGQTWQLLGYEGQEKYNVFHGFSLLNDLYEAVKQGDGENNQSRREAIHNIIYNQLVPNYFEEDELSNTLNVCYDHGILAAANLSSYFETAFENPIMKSAIRAIGIHNGAACTEQVFTDKDPLAFLLVLCDECQEWGRRIVVGDETVSESDQIYLHGMKPENQNYLLDKRLTVVFEYTDAALLNQSGWSYQLFRRSKELALGRLRVSEDFPIHQINYNVNIPHQVNLAKSMGSCLEF